jgi:hypothetical protein
LASLQTKPPNRPRATACGFLPLCFFTDALHPTPSSSNPGQRDSYHNDANRFALLSQEPSRPPRLPPVFSAVVIRARNSLLRVPPGGYTFQLRERGGIDRPPYPFLLEWLDHPAGGRAHEVIQKGGYDR